MLAHLKGVSLFPQEITDYFAQEMMWTIGWLHYWTSCSTFHYSRKSRPLRLMENFSKSVVKENWVIWLIS